MGITQFPQAAASGGGDDAVELGSSYATGNASATIVSAIANTDGVVISTLSLEGRASGGGPYYGEITVDGNVILRMQIEFDSQSATAISGIFVPAGQAIAFATDGSGSDLVSYYITYEVL